jgi:plasmid stabilization system protein ParE
MKVVWADRARRRVADDKLIRATAQLAEQPYIGALLPEDGAYRQLVVDEYRIVYRVAEKATYVMTIVGPGMLYEQAL